MLTYLEKMDVKRQLPPGSSLKIAEMARVSPSTVSSWWAGRTNNKKIEDCMFMLLIEERQKSEKKLQEAGLA